MPYLTVNAHITANKNKTALVKAELEKLVEPTRAEEGCVQYDLHQDIENPVHFMFQENWTSRELWQNHMETQHIKDYMAATEGAIEDFTVFEMIQLA